MNTRELVFLGLFSLACAFPAAAQENVIYAEDFEDEALEQWTLERGWATAGERGNRFLAGRGHQWARMEAGSEWMDYTFRSRVRLVEGGIHLNVRMSDDGRYFIGLREDMIYLNKEAPWGEFHELAGAEARIDPEGWHDIAIEVTGASIAVVLDGERVLAATDPEPLAAGGIALETLEESVANVDDLTVASYPPEPDRPSSPAKTYPVVKVVKSMDALGPDKTGVDVLDSATITIKLYGDSVPNPTGLSVVLILDESGSMDDLSQYSRAAAQAVVQLLGSTDKVALVAFSDSAKLVSGLTTQHAKVTAAIAGLPDPDGKTNVKAAFDLANTTLQNDTSAIKKVVFLFTDGMPTPATQADELRSKIQWLNTQNINYFTAAYGQFSKAWLMELAEDTGGAFCNPSTPGYITTCFQNFWTDASKHAHAQQVKIHEVVGSHFDVVSGSFTHSTSLKSMPTYLKDALKKAATSFYSTKVLETPPIYELPMGEHFTVSFGVSPKTCKPTETKLPVDDTTKTYLEYRYAGKKLTITHPQFNQVYVAVNPCGVYIEKTFEQANRVVEIEIRNTFQDRDVNDIHVIEILGDHVTPIPATATPFTYGSLGQVVWPHYPASSYTTPDGVEWRFFDGVPAAQPNDYPPHSWTIHGHGAIKPNTKLTLSLPVNAKASAKGKSPVVINREGKPDPDITVPGGTVTFWYYYDEFADTNIKSEQIGGLLYKYYYEDLSFGFSKKWGKKRHVVIDLPELNVTSLPPEWPVYK